MKGGLGFGAMLFLYKATQGDVSLDTVGMKSRKRISSITAPRVGWGFFPPFFFSIKLSLHTQSWCRLPYGAGWSARLLAIQFGISWLLGKYLG